MYIGLKTKNLRNMRNTIYLEIGEHVNEVGFKRKLGLLHSSTNEVVRHVNHSVGTYALTLGYRRFPPIAHVYLCGA